MTELCTRCQRPKELVPKEFALQSGVCVDTVRRWIKKGLIQYVRRGERLLFIPESELQRAKSLPDARDLSA